MKVNIEGTQEEFDLKRADLIKTIAGSKFDVVIKAKGEKLFDTPRLPRYKAQKEMLEYWGEKFDKLLSDIKADIDDIIK